MYAALHTQLSLYDYVSSITVPMGRYIAGLFYFQGKMPHDAGMTMIHGFPWMPVRLVYCCSCFFIAQMSVTALRIHIICRKAGIKMNAKNKKSAAKAIVQLKQKKHHSMSCSKMNVRYKGVTRLPRTMHVPHRAGRRI